MLRVVRLNHPLGWQKIVFEFQNRRRPNFQTITRLLTIRVSHEPSLTRTTFSIRQHQSSSRTMALESSLAALAACQIEPKGSLSHGPTSDPASWKSALASAPSQTATVPAAFKLTKTLIFKPKTAKSATPTPLVLIASEETDTRNTNALGKQLDLKELRLATDDLITEFFGVDKNSCTPIALFSSSF
jgi:hypothetical protein